MLRLINLSVPLDFTETALKSLLLHKTGLSDTQLLRFSVVRKSVDARDKSDVHFVLSVDMEVSDEKTALKKFAKLFQIGIYLKFSKVVHIVKKI